jgi:uncharacterized protein YoxC|tara:strand:+ start:334 stop:558 length:225 start_codon:yes stop_codon:yes gene_type:complete
MIDPSIIESLGVSAILAVLCITLIAKFIKVDSKVVAMHRRMDNLKDQITKAMEETKDEIQELNRDLLRSFRNGK